MWVTAGTDRRRQVTTSTTARDSQVVIKRSTTEHLWHASVTCHKTDQISSSRCAISIPPVRDVERVKRNGRYLSGKSIAKCLFRWQQGDELEAYSDADWDGDKATGRSVSAGVIMRGGHCLKVSTKREQVVSLSTAEGELCAAVKPAPEELAIQSVEKELGTVCWLKLHLDASATMCVVNHRGLGKAKHVDTQNLWIQESSKSKKSRYEREHRRLTTADKMITRREKYLGIKLGN